MSGCDPVPNRCFICSAVTTSPALQAVDPDEPGADPAPGRLALRRVVVGQRSAPLLRRVERSDLPGQVLVPRPRRELVQRHGTSQTAGERSRVATGGAVDERGVSGEGEGRGEGRGARGEGRGARGEGRGARGEGRGARGEGRRRGRRRGAQGGRRERDGGRRGVAERAGYQSAAFVAPSRIASLISSVRSGWGIALRSRGTISRRSSSR